LRGFGQILIHSAKGPAKICTCQHFPLEGSASVLTVASGISSATATAIGANTIGAARSEYDMSNFFYNLGRQLGRGAIPAIRQSKLVWDDLTGTEEDVLRAERALGNALATELRATTPLSGDPHIAEL